MPALGQSPPEGAEGPNLKSCVESAAASIQLKGPGQLAKAHAAVFMCYRNKMIAVCFGLKWHDVEMFLSSRVLDDH